MLKLFRQMLTVFLTLSLTSMPILSQETKIAPISSNKNVEVEYQNALKQMDTFMELVSKLRNTLNRSQFDTDALLEKLEFDAGKIIKYVSKEIYFEQYVGLLRGVKGTLMSRAGNSLDQAILLATLLNDAAYESRIVRGELNQDQIQELFKQLNRKKTKQTFANFKEYKKILLQMGKLAKISTEDIAALIENSLKEINLKDTSEYKDAVKDQKFVIELLNRSNLTLKPLDITEEIYSEAKDYFWVEYKGEGSDSWESIHPTVQNNPVFKNIVITEILTGTIPDKLQHRFRLEMFIEQKTGNTLQTKKIIDGWEKPVSNLNGKSLYYSNVLNGLTSQDDYLKPQELAERSNFFIPVFKVNGEVALQTDSFDMNGIVLDKIATGHIASDLFQTLGNKMENALQQTNNMEKTNKDQKAFRTLSAQWMELTQIAPDGKEKKVKKYIIDRIGVKNRQKKKYEITKYINENEAKWKLSTIHKFMLMTGSVPESYLQDQYINRLLSLKPLLKAIVKLAYYPSSTIEFNKFDLKQIESADLFMLTHLLNTTDEAIDSLGYHHEGSLVMIKHENIYHKDHIKRNKAIDIIQNSFRTVEIKNSKVYRIPSQNILLGTWATRIERMKVLFPQQDNVFVNTSTIFNEAQQAGIPLLILAPEDKSKIDQVVGILPEQKEAVLHDMSKGFHIIIPQKIVNQENNFGWWRVNTKTGETLGMVNEGLGANLGEYVVSLVIPLTLSAVLTYPGYVECRQNVQAETGKRCSKEGCYIAAGFSIVLSFSIAKVAGFISGALQRGAYLRAAPQVARGRYLVDSADEAAKLGQMIGESKGNSLWGLISTTSPIMPNCIEPPSSTPPYSYSPSGYGPAAGGGGGPGDRPLGAP